VALCILQVQGWLQDKRISSPNKGKLEDFTARGHKEPGLPTLESMNHFIHLHVKARYINSAFLSSKLISAKQDICLYSHSNHVFI